jgi:hypothetical protein
MPNLHDFDLGDMRPTFDTILDKCKCISKVIIREFCLLIMTVCVLIMFIPSAILELQGIKCSKFYIKKHRKRSPRKRSDKKDKVLETKKTPDAVLTELLVSKSIKFVEGCDKVAESYKEEKQVPPLISQESDGLDADGNGDSIHDPTLTKEQLDDELDRMCNRKDELTSKFSSQSLTDASLTIPIPIISPGITPTHTPTHSPIRERK